MSRTTRAVLVSTVMIVTNVLGRRAAPAQTTASARMGTRGTESVAASRASMGRPARTVSPADMETTALNVSTAGIA